MSKNGLIELKELTIISYKDNNFLTVLALPAAFINALCTSEFLVNLETC